MKIHSVYISNYKSYNAEGVTIPISTNITGFVGPNSAGKTNVLEALQLFFTPQKLTIDAFHKKSTDIPIRITITFLVDAGAKNDFPQKIFIKDGKLSLTRTYSWNEEKILRNQKKGEPFPSHAWMFIDEASPLNPFEKRSTSEIKKFLESDDSISFRETTGWEETTPTSEFYSKVELYWMLEKIQILIGVNIFDGQKLHV